MLQTFARLLPGHVESQFLRACIDPLPAGRQVWETWRAGHVLQQELERDGTGKKRLLPLLSYTLEQSGAVLDPADVPILRAARLREQLRAEKINSILTRALSDIYHSDVDVCLLKGAALAQTVYPSPDLRHTHDIDLLVCPPDLVRAAHVLRSHGFALAQEPAEDSSTDLRLVHSGGLPLVLHSNLFESPTFGLPGDEVWQDTIERQIEGVTVRLLSPELMLAHVLGHTFYTAARTFRVWVGDAYFLVTRTPPLDWERVTDVVIRANITVPLFLTLDYLHRALSLPVPARVLDDLNSAASKASQAEYESALTLLRRNGQGGYRYWLKSAQTMRERLQVAGWVARSYGKQL